MPSLQITGSIILLALVFGVFLEPFRVFQALTGRLGMDKPISDEDLRKATRLFYLALPFWGALLWAIWNINVLKRCSGDTCLGYSIFAMPFPFIYGFAELRLFVGNQRGKHKV